MNILRVAFLYNPEESEKNISKIYRDDVGINKLTKKLFEN